MDIYVDQSNWGPTEPVTHILYISYRLCLPTNLAKELKYKIWNVERVKFPRPRWPIFDLFVKWISLSRKIRLDNPLRRLSNFSKENRITRISTVILSASLLLANFASHQTGKGCDVRVASAGTSCRASVQRCTVSDAKSEIGRKRASPQTLSHLANSIGRDGSAALFTTAGGDKGRNAEIGTATVAIRPSRNQEVWATDDSIRADRMSLAKDKLALIAILGCASVGWSVYLIDQAERMKICRSRRGGSVSMVGPLRAG